MTRQQGFTLVELLVAVSIVGILAAIALPSYAEYQRDAVDRMVQSGIHDAAMALEGYYDDNDFSYAGATANLLEPYGFRRSPSLQMVIIVLGGRYWLVGWASGGTGFYLLDSNFGRIRRI